MAIIESTEGYNGEYKGQSLRVEGNNREYRGQ